MTKPEVRALVARLSREAVALRERLVLAPLLSGGRIRTRLHGLVYEFRVRESFTGWGQFQPRDERSAALVGEAQPWERAAYLALFPRLKVILLWPDQHRQATWWALPCNASDARQRFGLHGDPVLVFLCDPLDGAERFAQVLVAVDGQTLWYDGPDPLADPLHADWLRRAAGASSPPDHFPPSMSGAARTARLLATMRAGGGRPVGHADARGQVDPWFDRRAPVPDMGRSVEERLRRALDKADATLHSFTETPGHSGMATRLVAEWSERGSGARYRTVLNHNLTVVSSGICLSGRDHDFDLTSLVSVMNDAQ